MSAPLDCLDCKESEYSEYTSMTMCKITKAPAWMSYKERECIFYEESIEDEWQRQESASIDSDSRMLNNE